MATRKRRTTRLPQKAIGGALIGAATNIGMGLWDSHQQKKQQEEQKRLQHQQNWAQPLQQPMQQGMQQPIQQGMQQPMMQQPMMQQPMRQGGNIKGNVETGQFVDYNEGQDHEGPDEGIPVDEKGQPTTVSGGEAVALTEEGEVAFNGQVFSDELSLPGSKDRTFSDEAKRIKKKYEFYLGKDLDKKHERSSTAIQRELSKLFDIQEAKKGNMMHSEDVDQLLAQQQAEQERAVQEEMAAEQQMQQQGAPMQQQGMGQQGMPMEEGMPPGGQPGMGQQMPMMQRGGTLPGVTIEASRLYPPVSDRMHSIRPTTVEDNLYPQDEFGKYTGKHWISSSGEYGPGAEGRTGRERTPFYRHKPTDDIYSPEEYEQATTSRPPIKRKHGGSIPKYGDGGNPFSLGTGAWGAWDAVNQPDGPAVPEGYFDTSKTGGGTDSGQGLVPYQADWRQAGLEAGTAAIPAIVGLISEGRRDTPQLNLTRATPEEFNLEETRAAARERARTRKTAGFERLKNYGIGPGAYRAAAGQIAAEAERELGEQDAQSRAQEQKFNVQAIQQAAQANMQAAAQEEQDRVQRKEAGRQRKNAILGSLSGLPQQAIAGLMQRQQMYDMMNMQSPDYIYAQSRDASWHEPPQSVSREHPDLRMNRRGGRIRRKK